MAEKLDEPGLMALVANEVRSSTAYSDSELAKKRSTALDYYRGKMTDVPSEVGRSSAISRDVADTIGWMLPGIIRVFTASDRMATCEPVEMGDEDFADQASDGINHIFMKENDGYRILYNGTHDSLLMGNGVVKHWWDDTPVTKVSEHSGLSDDQFNQLVGEADIEVLAHTPNISKEEAVDEMGAPIMVDVTTHDVKIERTVRNGRIRVEAIPPEDFLMDREATTIESARFTGHRNRVPRSQLIEMGFARDKVEGLNASSVDREESISRREDWVVGADDIADASMTMVDLIECCVKADMDGDGIAETVRCFYAGDSSGGVLLDWEVWDSEPLFSDIPCTPMPHRWEAESIADETMDVQRIKTVLQRQALDNIYASNLPQRFVSGELHNPDELFNPSFGGVIFGKPGSAIVDMAVPFVADKALIGIEYQDQVIERRTGVSRSTMALDPEALTNQTATAVQAGRDAAYSQIELIARNQAELGWKKVFRAILRLLVKHQDKARMIRLRDKWVEMDPRYWNADMDITINVGLGTGSRDRDMAMLNVILQNQILLTDRLTGGGLGAEAIGMLPKIRNTLAKITESAGMKAPEQFFPEVTEEQVQQLQQKIEAQQGQPDPKVQLEQQKLQMDMQAKQADFQFEQAKMSAEQEAARERLAMEFQFKREQLQAELVLKRDQLVEELRLKRELEMERLMVTREMGMYSANVKASTATSGVSVGGEPG